MPDWETITGVCSFWRGMLAKAFWDSLLFFFETRAGIWKGIFIILLGMSVSTFIVRRWRSREDFSEHLISNVLIVIAGGICTWGLILICYFISEPFREQNDLVTQLNKTRSEETSALITQRGAEFQIAALKNTKCPVAQNCPTGSTTRKEREKCWLDNHFAFPNPSVKESHSATTAIFHCNYKIDAPFVVGVKFDSEFLYGNIGMPSVGVFSGTLGVKPQPGNVFIGQVNSPSLPANELITVTVEAPSQVHPRAIAEEVKSK